MERRVRTAFELSGIRIPIDKIFPTKNVKTDSNSATFRRIMASLKTVKLIEPLIVYPQTAGKSPTYALLDGHIRLEAMKLLGIKEVPCLISTEDESYTYNHKVNTVPPIQEHFMIMRAIENGVSEESIAVALAVDVANIRQKRDLLNGVCPETIELLKNKHVPVHALREIRKVKPMRQMEMAELMIRGHNFTTTYAKCLLAATPDEFLVEPHKPKVPRGIRSDEVSEMEKEMETLEQNFLALEDTHGTNVLHLVLATTYLRKLFDNATVVKFLMKNHPDISAELQRIMESTNLERIN